MADHHHTKTSRAWDVSFGSGYVYDFANRDLSNGRVRLVRACR
jgi:hypothetical protein